MARSTVSESLPQVDILSGLGRGLTAKQKRFAEEVAKGKKGSEAYRAAYNTRAKPKTQADTASKLRARPDIKAAIDAIEQANQAMKYQTAEGLRSLAVSSLVNVLIDPETSQAVKVQAARTIGTITEVSLFTHRTESKVIHSSDDIKAKILKEISTLMSSQADDVVARDAASLLTELTASSEPEQGGENSPDGETHPPVTPTCDDEESLAELHTIPQPLSQSENIPDPLSQSENIETPLSDFDAP